MILVDTSVWIEHLRWGNPNLAGLLNQGEVLCHPFVIGELACGSLKNRDRLLVLLNALPAVEAASQTEVLQFIETHKLMGLGLGFLDIHLLAAAALAHSPLWTLDKKLAHAAARFRLAYSA